jgi:hypothetical protein
MRVVEQNALTRPMKANLIALLALAVLTGAVYADTRPRKSSEVPVPQAQLSGSGTVTPVP